MTWTLINFDMDEQPDTPIRAPIDAEYVYATSRVALMQFLTDEIAQLTDEQRRELFAPWCSSCGGTAPCQCWNDE